MIVLNEIDNMKGVKCLEMVDEIVKLNNRIRYLERKVDNLNTKNISLENQLTNAKVEYTELENCLSKKIMEIKELERHENINYYNKYVYYKRISDTYEIELQERNRYIKVLEEENAMLLDEILGVKNGHK